MYWMIVVFVYVVLLVIYRNSKFTIIWNGSAIGLILGLLLTISGGFDGQEFYWAIPGVGAIIGTIYGVLMKLAEFLINFVMLNKAAWKRGEWSWELKGKS